MVLSLTVDGPMADARIICFQPATRTLKTGNEQMELYPIPGDGYSINGNVQAPYVLMQCLRHGHHTWPQQDAWPISSEMAFTECAMTTLQALQVLPLRCASTSMYLGICVIKLEVEKCYLHNFSIQLASTLEWVLQYAGNKEIGCALLTL